MQNIYSSSLNNQHDSYVMVTILLVFQVLFAELSRYLFRPLHCWEFSFKWWPTGSRQGFLLNIYMEQIAPKMIYANLLGKQMPPTKFTCVFRKPFGQKNAIQKISARWD